MHEFDEAMLRKGAQILNRDRTDSFNAFKNKSPGLLHDGLDDSPAISPVIASQVGMPYPNLQGMFIN